MAWAAAALRRSYGPCVAIRDATRSAKCASWARQILHIDPMPLVPDQQVLIGGKRLKTFSEAPDKAFRLTSRGLAGIACTILSMFLAR
jgi:hypothetical protein